MAEKKENDVIGLAKTNATKKTTTRKKTTAAKTSAKTTPRIPAANKSEEKKLTPEEERDLKAKETVKRLLDDSTIMTEKKDELLDIDEVDEPKGIDWLEEQITLLSEKNKELTTEVNLLKIENENLKNNPHSGDADTKKSVLQLFNELQENHMKLGVNEQGIGNFRIYCPGFLNRLIKFFPFLEEYKRYQ